MSRIKTHVKKGDLVEVTSGVEQGKQGHVLQVLPQKGYVLVEGVRMIKKSVRPSQDKPQGGFAEREGTIHISNVKVVESKK
ncbi:LSU ribosomal protein L24P [Roseimicrobium gellanilyticum]|jgi:large subunit ribosomal protein L24|uniref:Large ribosomal subunit protein uL24 n=1 Tax=Roseimicrobium gellanilyticum TaxID=748857 RepID=A0A366HUD2_9BACT|nr:50S ribosomal protein L24 [Roseimicrobium gellanilyticum]RBP47882.1 LSU ribosomal protein L24P [Roseimicrobium gellanilyticum]